MAELWAHSANAAGKRHELTAHLNAVAQRAKTFADKWDGGQIAEMLGWGHDLAKASPKFQRYLLAAEKGITADKCPHSAPSALAIVDYLGTFAMVVQGHHAGLGTRHDLNAVQTGVDPEVHDAAKDFARNFNFERVAQHAAGRTALDAEHLIRMSLSALVDADFLDTEEHFAGRARSHAYPKLDQYLKQLEQRLTQFANDDGEVFKVRREVQTACAEAALAETGFFRLTVPTGGGKTLASLLFALKHAVHHGMDRVIIAIPYTSIIEQTAAVYKRIFGDENVLEHHSAIEVDETEDFSPMVARQRLAAENWDCPLVVTTNVQLFESLLSNRVSKCRKLHNIARSTVVLDEAQSLPPDLIECTTSVLDWMVRNARTSVVYCTATQPDFTGVMGVPTKLVKAREIVANFPEHFSRLKRVEFVDIGKQTHAEVAARASESKQVLVIVNTKKDSAKIFQFVDGDDVFYLSTWLTADHRREVLAEVRRRLDEGLPCRLISTQVVEAGVDVDFPTVLRAMGPMDSMVQAAGRCNRAGKLPHLGTCEVFELVDGGTPGGVYRTAVDTTRLFLPGRLAEVGTPKLQSEYTRQFFASTGTDRRVKGSPPIQELREKLDYRTVAQHSRLIEEDTTAVVVEARAPERVRDLLERVMNGGSPRLAARILGPVSISFRQLELIKAMDDQLIEVHPTGFYIWVGPYDRNLGVGGNTMYAPADVFA